MSHNIETLYSLADAGMRAAMGVDLALMRSEFDGIQPAYNRYMGVKRQMFESKGNEPPLPSNKIKFIPLPPMAKKYRRRYGDKVPTGREHSHELSDLFHRRRAIGGVASRFMFFRRYRRYRRFRPRYRRYRRRYTRR